MHGGPRSECPDDTKQWFPQRHICYVEMQLEGARNLYADRHKDLPYHEGRFQSWAKDRSPSHPFHFSDGVTIWMAPSELNPDDDFLGQAASAREDGPDDGLVA